MNTNSLSIELTFCRSFFLQRQFQTWQSLQVQDVYSMDGVKLGEYFLGIPKSLLELLEKIISKPAESQKSLLVSSETSSSPTSRWTVGSNAMFEEKTEAKNTSSTYLLTDAYIHSAIAFSMNTETGPEDPHVISRMFYLPFDAQDAHYRHFDLVIDMDKRDRIQISPSG